MFLTATQGGARVEDDHSIGPGLASFDLSGQEGKTRVL